MPVMLVKELIINSNSISSSLAGLMLRSTRVAPTNRPLGIRISLGSGNEIFGSKNEIEELKDELCCSWIPILDWLWIPINIQRAAADNN